MMNTKYNKPLQLASRLSKPFCGKSDRAKQQGPVSFDNLKDMVISYSLYILGQIINNQQMDIQTPEEFVTKVLQALSSTWGPHWKAFFLQVTESLTSKLGDIGSMMSWL